MSFRNLNVLLTANSTSLRSQLNAAATQVDKFSSKVQGSNKSMISSTKLMQAAVVGGVTAVAAAMAYSVVSAAKFEQSMRNVNSISGLSEEKFKALGQSVMDLSTAVPQSATQLADGLYDIASSGFQGAEGLQVLEAAAVAASAGMSTTATSAKAITAVLNAYGLGASDAADVSDTLFQTVNLGVLSFEELAGSIGDVVGIAAVTGVTVDQLGGAIAAMTKQGISGSESATLLTNLFTKMLRPSEALQQQMSAMGYESGEAMLKANGLRGSMELLRGATNGNATALFNLFPDIQAARGALALMANEGKTYAEVATQIEDKTKRSGATLKTFKEQSKAVTFQFKLFVNQINKSAISLGSRLLPIVLQSMKAIQRLGGGMGDALNLLKPFFNSIGAIGADLLTILGAMATAVAPVAKAIAGLTFGALAVTLNTVASALAAVTGFVADNEEAMAALAGVLTALLLPALSRMVAALATQIFVGAVMGISNLIGAVGTASTALTGMGVAATFATAGIGAVVALGVIGLQRIGDAADKGRSSVQEMYKQMGKPTNDPGKVASRQARLNDELEKQRAIVKDLSGLNLHNPFSSNDPMGKAQGKVEELEKTIKQLDSTSGNTKANLSEMAAQTGRSWTELARFADANNVNLTGSYEESADARQKVITQIKDMEAAAGTSSGVLAANAGQDIAAMEELAEHIAKVAEEVDKAFSGDTDVIANFKVEAGKGSAGSQLKAYYQDTIKETEAFSRQITEVTAKGLDPAMVSRLLQAGPEAAGPILQGMLSDHSGKMIEMANQSEEALSKINIKIVEFSRLTTLATTSSSDQMVKDLDIAMAVAAENMTQGAKATVSSIARALKQDEGTVRRVAESYGITIADAAQRAVDRKPLQLKVNADLAAAYAAGEQAAIAAEKAFARNRPGAAPSMPGSTPNPKSSGPSRRNVTAASGGYIRGPGTGTSDSIPAYLSNGEYVVRAAAVRNVGVGALHRINARGYAAGGPVTRDMPMRGGDPDLGKTIAKAVARAIKDIPRNSLNVTVPADSPNRYAGAVVEEAVFAARLGRLN